MYDIIFSDYDGTLYGKSGQISTRTATNIAKYINEGGKFVISTGRIYSSILPVAKMLNLNDDIITSQGSQIYNIKSNIPVKTYLMDRNKVVDVMKIAKENNCLTQCYANNIIYADSQHEFNNFFEKFFGVEINKQKNLMLEVEQGNIKLNKFEMLVDKDIINDLIKDLAKEFPEFLFSKSAPVMIEVVDKKATKGRAVEYLLNKYNISSQNALAIGDGNNDIDMLEAVGGKVAVPNGAERLLKIADYITKDNNGDGVGEIIEMILRGENIK